MAVIERDAVQQNLPATQQQPAEASGTAALMRLIERAALDPTFDVSKLKELFAMKKEWDIEEARKEFAAAMAAFKLNPPQIIKDAHVSYATKGGGNTAYNHESIGRVCAAVIPALAAVGITHRWALHQQPGQVKVICVLTHRLGHHEETPLFAEHDASGGKNDIQAVGSTVKYLERYTLLAAVGLAPMDRDDDGRGASRPRTAANGTAVGSGFINDNQAADLDAMISEIGTNKAQFLRFMKVDEFAQIPASKMQIAVQQLNDIRRGINDRKEREARGAKR